MKVYKDKELTEDCGKTLDLGVVPAGETQRFEFYIHNDSKAWIREIKFTVGHPEVRVIDAPTELQSGDMGVLVLEWAALVNVKAGVKARLGIDAKELWRSGI